MKYSDAKAFKNWSHVIVYGESGTGKSTLASRLALTKKLIWISCDNGHRVLDKLPPAAQDNIDIIIIPDTRDSPTAHDTVRKLMKGVLCHVCHSHGIVDCSVCRKNSLPFSSYEFRNNSDNTIVVLDHLTRVTDSCLAQICKGKDPDYKPKLDDWGSLRFHLASLMGDIQAASFNIVCIAQAMQSTEEGGSKKLMPSVGSYEFGRMVNQYFDHIVYCDIGVKEGKRDHIFGSGTTFSPNAQTKSRTDVEIEKLKVASLEEFFAPGNAVDRKDNRVTTAVNSMQEIAKVGAAALTMEPPAETRPAPSSSVADALAKLKGLK